MNSTGRNLNKFKCTFRCNQHLSFEHYIPFWVLRLTLFGLNFEPVKSVCIVPNKYGLFVRIIYSTFVRRFLLFFFSFNLYWDKIIEFYQTQEYDYNTNANVLNIMSISLALSRIPNIKNIFWIIIWNLIYTFLSFDFGKM